MIYPKKNKLVRWVFHHYIVSLVQRNFHEVKFNKMSVGNDRSVLLLANHFSWWDGFLMYYINHMVLKKNFQVMVIEETVKSVPFLKYVGAFSVSKNSRDILTSLDYAAELLNDPANLVLIFPQGKLYSNFADEPIFEKGLERIMRNAQGKFQTVYAATFIENLQYKKPTANVYLKVDDQYSAAPVVKDVQEAYQLHYNSSKLVQTEIVV